MAASMQYLKCEYRDDAAEVCSHHQDIKDANQRKSMYCPPDDPRVRCMAAAWTPKSKHNHENILPGSDNFPLYGSDLQELMANSWERYAAMGEGSFLTDTLVIDEERAPPSKMLYLAVSASKVRTIETEGKIGHHKNFPFSSGDWTSNVTPAFLDRMRIDLSKEKDLLNNMLPKVGL
jgi:hypothetical protein